MIVKIKSFKRPHFKKLLEYMLHEESRLFDEGNKSFVLTHNLKGNSIESWVNQFQSNEKLRLRKRKDSVILTHEILSWHSDDSENVSLEKMQKMAEEYIQQRNPKGIYVAIPHFDKDHFHIHICTSGVEYRTGKSLRLSKEKFLKLKKNIQEYQIKHFPELNNSVVEHGKKSNLKANEKEYQLKLRTGRDSEREQVSAILKTCFKKADSKDSFLELLDDCGLKTYERSGKITGVLFGKNKFRFNRLGFTDEKFEQLNLMNRKQRELSDLRNTKQSKARSITR